MFVHWFNSKTTSLTLIKLYNNRKCLKETSVDLSNESFFQIIFGRQISTLIDYGPYVISTVSTSYRYVVTNGFSYIYPILNYVHFLISLNQTKLTWILCVDFCGLIRLSIITTDVFLLWKFWQMCAYNGYWCRLYFNNAVSDSSIFALVFTSTWLWIATSLFDAKSTDIIACR